ncbi:type II secretion system F family protein [Caldisalinibacter kiritimatiensis]|uniref:Type II secretion system protein GspF domain-containing protein n=1 Tax=Caldisalinibacter kiritimatiensis TaxID=1304284 RepID=R1AXN7_9FIRM|nr:hypothetical protein [Caldisalinibacter kiritimatiensis]EOD01417.1 hypothetical protein L21TH_0464 [Caldisalinibacter kiritimatiensis]
MVLIPIAVVSISYIFYLLLDESDNIKVDKIKENARYIENTVQRQMDKMLRGNKKTAKHITSTEKMLQESVFLRAIGIRNIYIFLIITVIFSFFAFQKSRIALNQTIGAGIVAFIAFQVPFEILKIEVELKRKSIRKHLPNFFLTVSQMLEAADDIVDVLETSINKIKKPLKTDIKEFVKNYRKGKTVEECIEILKSRFDNPLLEKFADDIEGNIKNGTKLKGVIDDYAEKSYNNQTNYMQRITENSGSILASLIILVMFINSIYTVKRLKPELFYILTHNFFGQVTVDIIIILTIVSIKMTLKSISYNDSQ